MARTGFSLALLCAACTAFVARGKQLEETVLARTSRTTPRSPGGFPWIPLDLFRFHGIVKDIFRIASNCFKNVGFPRGNPARITSEFLGSPQVPSESPASSHVPSESIGSTKFPSEILGSVRIPSESLGSSRNSSESLQSTRISSAVAIGLPKASIPCFGDSHDDDGDDLRIVGGDDVEIEAHPWQVSFQINCRHVCGGSIINERWILTAKHCLDRATSVKEVTIRMGTATVDRGGRVYQAESIAVNPRSARPLHYDVGLVRLAKAIAFGDEIRAVTLVSEGREPLEGEKLTVTGWGALREGTSRLPRTLQGVIVPVVDHVLCAAAYRRMEIDATMICAGYREGGRDACKGDSGGPVTNSERVLVGVVSWGVGCARPGVPGVYSNLANPAIRSWIRKTTGT